MIPIKLLIVVTALIALSNATPIPGFLGKHSEHHTIHVPYKIHTIHHTHIQKVPVIKEVVKEVPVIKEVVKEVPIVKEVVKEVPVVKEVVKEVPVYNTVHVPVYKEVHVPVHIPVHVHHKQQEHHEDHKWLSSGW